MGPFCIFQIKLKYLYYSINSTMDLNIEENTLKHQNVNVPTEYNVSEGIEYYLYTFLKLS